MTKLSGGDQLKENNMKTINEQPLPEEDENGLPF